MLKSIVYILIIFLFFSAKSLSSEKITYVDIEYLFKNSDLGNKIYLKLNDENNNIKKKLKEKEKKLIEIEKELINQKNIISKEEFNKRLSALNDEVKLFRNERKSIIKNFETEKSKEINSFFQKITPILEEYMIENSIHFILDKKNVLIADKKLEITNNLINIINEKLK